MTNREKMLKLVLDNPKLKEEYEYTDSDYEDFDTALNNEDCPVVQVVARAIADLGESTDPSIQKKVYQYMFNYLNNNLMI